jgi:hypothetical protein
MVEHDIIAGGPIVVLFSDQNFVPTLACSENRCINIVRVENANLDELLDIATKLFEQICVPKGSVFAFGSVSHLSRIGTSHFADDCPGSIGRELTELCVWLSHIYENNPMGLGSVWASVAAAVNELSSGTVLLDSPDVPTKPLCRLG